MRIRNLLLAATILSVPTLAAAQAPVSGLYVGAGVGANWLQEESLRSVDVGGTRVNTGKTKLQYDVGGRALASVGYGFGNGLRAELEGDYFINGLTKIGQNQGGGLGTQFNQLPGVRAKGQEQKYGGFLNVLYDINPSNYGLGSWPVTPYVGLGAGYLQVVDHQVRISQGSSSLLRDQGTAGNFAYQAILGIAYPLDMVVPGLALTAEYRFTGMADNRKLNGQYFAPNLTTSARLHEAQDYNHSLLLGVRYAFNAAPPPPPPTPIAAPAPAVVPSRTYLVFFDWDRSDLTGRARQIVADAAANSKRVQYTRIEVNGYTDRSGTPQYNQGLSVRRAQTVAGELVRDGVPQSAIDIQGFGETHPLVPTASGVREPQNRRVEIILR